MPYRFKVIDVTEILIRLAKFLRYPRYLRAYNYALIAAIPGNTLPSKYSNNAPPPVLM